ncbi:MAG: hypothetical protein JO297_14365 [Nitrososphaeraceae archaeon]|nr:hypothetical protein [Nitrososphaeraceae archaeon]
MKHQVQLQQEQQEQEQQEQEQQEQEQQEQELQNKRKKGEQLRDQKRNKRGRILLVDDELDSCLVYQLVLEDAGFTAYHI